MRSPRPVPECGSEAAYSRHRRRGDEIDDACRAAHSRNGSQNKLLRKARVATGEMEARQPRSLTAQSEALEALTHRYPEEFRVLLEALRRRAMLKLAEAHDEEYGALYQRVLSELEESDA